MEEINSYGKISNYRELLIEVLDIVKSIEFYI